MRKCIAVDIDETLCDTRRFWFSELSRLFGAPFHLSTAQLIESFEYTDRVPMWQTREAKAWLSEARCNSEIHRERLEPVVGALQGMLRISQHFDIVYMTMRPDTIIEATRDWLDSQKFPRGEIVASPACLFDVERPAWKGRELLARHPGVVGLIDDHPDVIEAISPEYRGKVFLLGQEVAPRTDIDIVPCRDWPAVVEQVSRAFPRVLQP